MEIIRENQTKMLKIKNLEKRGKAFDGLIRRIHRGENKRSVNSKTGQQKYIN